VSVVSQEQLSPSAIPKDADLRRRRREWVRSTTHRVRSGTSRRDASEAQCGRGRVVGWFGAEDAARTVALSLSKGRRNTWLRRTCKGAPYEVETRGAACKGGLAVRRHAGGLYEAGSYCYTLVKCVKPFVRNEKGVIGVNDHTQGPPINSGSLVIERTHINEKRAPKASV
jgi:hypothetical protein